ncbi:cytochrome c biogenesis protein CcdA [Methanolobus sp.]|uniref:cytochrome c biogenesis protein CcdA n=1 Tax=Methanolobus sp. TaxID=1874737 RepID=UPI0025E3CBBF|nr:cytochrome c biogenesis protein CcdA [Methanolobus sp.]
MKKKPVLQQPVINLLLLVLCTFFLVQVPAVTATPDEVQVEYFSDPACIKCTKAAPVIEDVAGRYEHVNFTNYDIRSSFTYAQHYGITLVPAVVINKSVVISYEDYNGDIALLENLLIEGIENPPAAESPEVFWKSDPFQNEGLILGKSHLLVFIAGLLAGFNPCLLAVMAFLSSAIISSNGTRRDMLTLVCGFCTGIFVTYMVVGIGILNTINSFPDIQETITMLMVVLIFALGIWHLYDAFYMKVHQKGTFRTPRFFIRFMGEIKGRNILMLSFIAGGLFSLIKAPCVGAVYLAILDMLISGNDPLGSAVYLGIYNFGVVLPILLLGGMLAFGLNPEKVSDFKERRRVEIRLITGMTLILLAVLLQLKVI